MKKSKVRKPIIWEDYQPLVYRLANQFWLKLPPRHQCLYEVHDLVNHCACRWNYLVSVYDPQYAFTTLLYRSCVRMMFEYVKESYKEQSDMPFIENVVLTEEGEIDVFDTIPTERVSNHSFVGADTRFVQLYTLASNDLRNLLDYILRGGYESGTKRAAKTYGWIRPGSENDETWPDIIGYFETVEDGGLTWVDCKRGRVKAELKTLAKRFGLTYHDILNFYGSAQASGPIKMKKASRYVYDSMR